MNPEEKQRGSGLVGFLACKTKVRPEDFIVEERISLSPGATGRLYLYCLKKTGWNTVDALIRIAKENRLSLRDLAYGGKKDRHGFTSQFITCPRELRLPASLNEAVELVKMGRTDTAMGPGRIAGNSFTLVLRSLQPSEISHLERNLMALKQWGFINYFDSQRFSTFDREEGLPARALFAGDPEACLKQLLLGEFRREKTHAKDRKDALRRIWGDWRRCEQAAGTNVERRVFAHLARIAGDQRRIAPEDFLAALELLPFEELLMMFSAFQAFLWNHMVARWIEAKSPRAGRFKTRTGVLAFPHPGDEETLFPERDFELCLPGRDETYHAEFRHRLDTILHEEGLAPGCTASAPLQTASMNAYMRRTRVIPDDLTLSEIEDDDLYPKRKKATLRFTLPPGSYGTMLVKRLTLRARF